MYFFERQRQSKRNTTWLSILFLLNVFVISVLNGLVVALIMQEPKAGPVTFVISALVFIFFTNHYAKVSRDGHRLAENLGAVRIQANLASQPEKRILNVVDEMAIAAGIVIPPVYVLRGEESINAFAAGQGVNESIIAVTDGALQKLSRDELQALIGHELSHILHEDIELNSKVIGAVAGFQYFSNFGSWVTGQGRRTRGNLRMFLLAFGGSLYFLGLFGHFLGRVLQFAISRQREYLADAASAQYTRNPSALASVLGKIVTDGQDSGTLLHHSHCAHIFFSDVGIKGFDGWMSTHPPLEKRLKSLIPNVNLPQFLYDLALSVRRKNAEVKSPDSSRYDSFSHSTNEEVMYWLEIVKDRNQAIFVLLALLLKSQPNSENKIAELTERANGRLDMDGIIKVFNANLSARVNILSGCLSTLQLDLPKERQKILEKVHELFWSDHCFTLQEALLLSICTRYLVQPDVLRPIKEDILDAPRSLLISYFTGLQKVDFDRLHQALAAIRRFPLKQRQNFIEVVEAAAPISEILNLKLLRLAAEVPAG